ncbi:MAG TPA: alpha-glucuronidase family glycosyl hydrolase [Ohtaekwangia sp.]
MGKLTLGLVAWLCAAFFTVTAEDGYRLWLRYDQIQDAQQLKIYTQSVKNFYVDGNSPTHEVISRELTSGLQGLLGKSYPSTKTIQAGTLLVALNSSPLLSPLNLSEKLKSAGEEGFGIYTTTVQGKKVIVVTANHQQGLLYGAFHFLRLLQTQQNISSLAIISTPKIKVRVLNHWDNLDRTIERGFAGFSLWDWHKLPDYLDPRYVEYARANASVGINGTVLTNVNANALILREDYLKKVAALADLFRPYGIKVYLTARFSAPIESGGLKTADPLDDEVKQWWKNKAAEIYKLIPDFGGFLVKANSEGQPGPQNYGRSHAEGANMLADAVKPFGGIVMWRAFVYDNNVPDDRAKQAYNEFKPLDGTFRDNVLAQVKNGPIDFQPREPFHPLFGAMPKTPIMMEFQITQEYLGFATHLVFLPSLFKEVLDTDTYVNGKNSTVAKVVDGSLDNHTLTGIAGVANIGNDRNWCGHQMGQANWYGYGRLAWDHQLTPDQIAEEWTRMTFSNKAEVISAVKSMLLASHQAVVNYMTPLGLHHIMGYNHHYGPGPWINKGRADWTSVYYHKADSAGIGFNRTSTGSKALDQYAAPVKQQLESLETCPEKYLLWFHHLPWTYKVKSGRILWDEICYAYNDGVNAVRKMQKEWNSLEGKVDAERFWMVKDFLSIQEKEAVWWRDACLSYFQSYSHLPIPNGLDKPKYSLEHYEKLSFPYAPGIRPQW